MLSVNNVICIFIIAMYSGIVFSDDLKEETIDRGAHSDRSGLWFGPRLGKRSLTISNEDSRPFLRLLEAADALKYYYDQLPYYEAQADEPEAKVTKKVIFTPKLGRSLDAYYDKRVSENVDFTPRLGRRLTDDMPATPPDQELYRPDPEQLSRKYFSPRLGRNLNLTPRLGRELYEIYPRQIRVVRSANKTTSS
ncbi:PBAN-type neuropeptides-like [Achroia grisella]|uniref:PBAN-type neuropeptides-like n=1 Tax=Achroia grisella TaxID=688607 RepID=UPI0027D2B240|nr:PBAN-type neuropeptides-like [Achroia grisella]